MEQNGPGLEYRVTWKPQGASVEWEEETVTNHTLRVMTPTVYAPYEVQVQATNSLGAGPEPQSVVLYSGEDCKCPLSAVSVRHIALLSVSTAPLPVGTQGDVTRGSCVRVGCRRSISIEW